MRKQHSNMSKMIYYRETQSAVKYSETSIKWTPSGPSQVSAQQRFVKIAQCLSTINIQRLLCTVIKLRVVKEAIKSSTSLPFITNFNLLPNEKTLTVTTVRISRRQSNSTIVISVWCPLNRGFQQKKLSKYNSFQCPCPPNRGVRRIEVRYTGKYRTLISEPGLVSA